MFCWKPKPLVHVILYILVSNSQCFVHIPNSREVRSLLEFSRQPVKPQQPIYNCRRRLTAVPPPREVLRVSVHNNAAETCETRSQKGENVTENRNGSRPTFKGIWQRLFRRKGRRNDKMNGNQYGFVSSEGADHHSEFDLSMNPTNFTEHETQYHDMMAHNAPSLSPQSPIQSPYEMSTDGGRSLIAVVEGSRATRTIPEIDEKMAEEMKKPLYELTPPDRKLNNLEQEFRDMLETFSNYSHHDILSLPEERIRTVFEGVIASAYEPAVYRAFEVLYEDLYPLRVAARVVYKKMLSLIEKSKAQRQEDIDNVVEATGLDGLQVEACRFAFVTTASKINKGPFLTKEQLISSGFLDETQTLVHPRPADLLMEELGKAERGKVSFADLMVGLYDCASEECSVERQCDTLLLMEQIMKSIEDVAARPIHKEKMDQKKIEYGQRYDEMVDAFRDWRDMVPQGQGRRIDVVRGCFVGAENPAIVGALRVCYVDFSGLRLAAEIIFKLVSSYMSSRKRTIQSTK